VVCILLATLRMPDTIERRHRTAHGPRSEGIRIACFAFLALIAAAAPAIAQAGANDAAADDAWTPPRHVRPEHPVRELVEAAARRAPLIRDLVEQLEGLDVTVYIRARSFWQTDLEGQVALLASAHGHRYLIIELACGRLELTEMATLAHELFHALEIAREPSIVDTRTLAAFYARTGRQTSGMSGRLTFETTAAAEAGQRARRELLQNTTRHRNGT
jgi:hypothetical protein